MEIGTVVCFKSTGELCTVIGLVEPGGRVYIRRPIMQQQGITHSGDVVYLNELETVEEHLRREAKEMLLKVKIQNEMQQEIEKENRAKPITEMVN